MKRTTHITPTRRQIVFARDRWTCTYCRKHAIEFLVIKRNHRPYIVPVGHDKKWMEIDHVVPYRDTQDNTIENLKTSCWTCNNKKG